MPLGKYYLVETATIEGFVLDSTPIEADLSYVDQDTEVVYAGMDVTNERQKVKITVVKTDSETKKPLEGAVFGLFAKEDIVNSEGTVIVVADERIEKAVTGADGTVTFVSDLPLGQYYVKEIEAPKGYVKSDEVFDVDVIDIVCEWNDELIRYTSQELNELSQGQDKSSLEVKLASLKQDEIRLDKMFEQTKYPAEIEALAVQLADAFIERLGLVGIDQSVKELTDSIRSEPVKGGAR